VIVVRGSALDFDMFLREQQTWLLSRGHCPPELFSSAAALVSVLFMERLFIFGPRLFLTLAYALKRLQEIRSVFGTNGAIRTRLISLVSIVLMPQKRLPIVCTILLQ